MNRTDTWRRAAAVVLAVVCFLLVPQVAQAMFSVRQAPAGTGVSIARMATISSVTGSFQCTSNAGRLAAGGTATIRGVGDAGQLGGTTYEVEVSDNGATSAPLSNKQGSVTHTQEFRLFRSSTYTVTVTASFRSWTTEWSREFTCNPFSTATTTF